jgi:hypothetical protein
MLVAWQDSIYFPVGGPESVVVVVVVYLYLYLTTIMSEA